MYMYLLVRAMQLDASACLSSILDLLLVLFLADNNYLRANLANHKRHEIKICYKKAELHQVSIIIVYYQFKKKLHAHWVLVYYNASNLDV